MSRTGAPSRDNASGNSAKVLLDLNHPGFQSELFALDAPEIRKVFKTLTKLRALTWSEVFQDHGLKWEELRSLPRQIHDSIILVLPRGRGMGKRIHALPDHPSRPRRGLRTEIGAQADRPPLAFGEEVPPRRALPRRQEPFSRSGHSPCISPRRPPHQTKRAF